MTSQSRILRRAYTGNLSLKITDHCRTTCLLPKFSPSNTKLASNGRKLENGLILCEMENVLSPQECVEIIENGDKCIFQDMSDKYRFGKQRNSSRLVALDKTLADNLWQNIKPVLSKEMEDLGISKQPLGFDVSRGEWELHSLNEAMRINKYSGEKKEYFGPHKDAQYCPSGDERSLFTLVIYLNEDFQGGETCFYFPKDITKGTKGTTTQEEIDSHGGLTKGFNCAKIVPKIAHAVLFSPNILHESSPILKGTKYTLKTDVVLKRHFKQFGFAVEEREKEDYLACLNYFREAQQQELQGNFDDASDLYERALSVRYCYPRCLAMAESDPVTSDEKPSECRFLPLEIWQNIFRYLPGHDAQSLVYAYPILNVAKECLEQKERNNVSRLSEQKFLPKINYRKAVLTCFEFPDADFFGKNESGCCRVAAMYSFFLLGHGPEDDVYTVRYNPDTQDVCAVALETLLSDVFHGRRCYGSFYNVRPQEPKKEDPKKDFEASVDRDYMLLRHGAEFSGVELLDSFYVKSAAYLRRDDIQARDEEDKDKETKEDSSNDQVAADSEAKVQEQIFKEMCDGSVPISKTPYQLHPLFRKYLLLHERYSDSALLFIPPAVSEDRYDYKWDAFQYYDMPAQEVYSKGLERVLDTKHNVSFMLVSKLKKPLSFERGNTACTGLDGPSRKLLDRVADSCTTEFYNHLVFDFQTAQLSVKCCGSDTDDQSVQNLFATYQYGKILEDQHLFGCDGEEMFYEVNIEPILSSDTSFNHAACNCCNPRFDVHEYCNIKHYPYLNRIFLVAREKDGKMLVWSVYGGIVAL